MQEPNTSELMQYAAQRAEGRPEFIASALAAYRERHGVDDLAIARRLGVGADGYARLALCLWPRPADAYFRERVDNIAAFVRARVDVLTEILT